MTAQIAYGDGATKRTIANVAYGDGATKRTLKGIFYGDGATVRQVFNAYTSITGITATPSSVFKTDNLLEPAPSSKTVTSGAVAIAWSGGNPGATVSWARLSGDATMTQTGTTSSTWSALVPKNNSKSATYRATVSDGISSGTVDVVVTLEYTAS